MSDPTAQGRRRQLIDDDQMPEPYSELDGKVPRHRGLDEEEEETGVDPAFPSPLDSEEQGNEERERDIIALMNGVPALSREEAERVVDGGELD